jgi:hypothetical protein
MSPILGYFDPGSGSLLLQAILGGAAGLLVFAKYLWDRIVRSRKVDGPSSDSGSEVHRTATTSSPVRECEAGPVNPPRPP